jgi:hypothetical protein
MAVLQYGKFCFKKPNLGYGGRIRWRLRWDTERLMTIYRVQKLILQNTKIFPDSRFDSR